MGERHEEVVNYDRFYWFEMINVSRLFKVSFSSFEQAHLTLDSENNVKNEFDAITTNVNFLSIYFSIRKVHACWQFREIDTKVWQINDWFSFVEKVIRYFN